MNQAKGDKPVVLCRAWQTYFLKAKILKDKHFSMLFSNPDKYNLESSPPHYLEETFFYN